MELELTTVRKSLNKAYLREKVERSHFEETVGKLRKLSSEIEQAKDAGESEEHFKTFLNRFFKKTGFEDYYINTDGRTDLVIHNGSKKKDTVGVMIETKKPGSREMITEADPNRKALHESILYYLRERVEKNNTDNKHIIITDLEHWFLFDAQEFDRHFYRNGSLKKEYTKWTKDQKTSSNTSMMYSIIEDFLNDYDGSLKATHVQLSKYRKLLAKDELTEKEERKLIPLIKLLSPVHLLKKSFSNDSNSLNSRFYNELLYIIGLEEKAKGSAKLIDRLDEDGRITGSLIENTINTLRYESRLRNIEEPAVTYGDSKEDQLFGVALELCIHWVNRILFLKLLESQLYRYHREEPEFKFLNYEQVDEFDELNKLFFRVLAIQEDERQESVQEKYGHIPYLNSSLFDVAELEDRTTRISGLDDKVTMPVYSKTVLKDQKGKSIKGKELNTLEYLFRFLEAYDFSAEGKEEIQEENKSLINASVLGLIFEKINGYKDGSFYTPGFITEYMCRETLRKAVTNKFNRLYKWDCEEFGDLYNKISRQDISLPEANQVVDSLTVCDPAVGSGHFLVSALNEMIAIKSELGIFCDAYYKVFRGTTVQVENDELVVTYGDDQLFEYSVKPEWDSGAVTRSVNTETQRLQKALFEEKRRLIENSLFGVDINPNSVRICRLRLWIELLKNAYYTKESGYQKLEVLPNIDINIKQGNSLVSRFDLDIDLEQILKETDYTLDDYKQAVADYKETRDQEKKRELRTLIKKMKDAFTVGLEELHPERRKLKKAEAKLIREQTQHDMFGDDDEYGGSREMRVKKLEKELAKQQEVVDELEAGAFYRQAFEWRFEFPEVLDDNGSFTGFDVVIGNPPYGISFSKNERDFLKNSFDYSYSESAAFFSILGDDILKMNGSHSYIVPKSITYSSNYSDLRDIFLEDLTSIVDVGKAWKEVKLEMTIFVRSKDKLSKYYSSQKADLREAEIKYLCKINKSEVKEFGFYLNGITEAELKLAKKIISSNLFLGDIANNERGEGLQKKIKKEGDIGIIGGGQIERYGIKDVRGYISSNIKWRDKAEINSNSILAQNIVAHIKNPTDHIKITSCIPQRSDVLILDTINQISIERFLSKKQCWALLNSDLINWYVYLFIYGKAIRTMHFDNAVTDRIPLPPKIARKLGYKIDKIVDDLLQESNNHEATNDNGDLRNKLNDYIYELYNLNSAEVNLVKKGMGTIDDQE